MNLEKLIALAASVVIGAAATGRLDSLQRWIWTAQAKVAYESRASNWGSPRFFKQPQVRISKRADFNHRSAPLASSNN